MNPNVLRGIIFFLKTFLITLNISDSCIITNTFRNVTAILKIEVQHFCFIEVFSAPIQLLCNHRCYLSGRQSSTFWCFHQPLSWCLSLSYLWSMTPWSNCTPTTGTKLSGVSWCTSLCVHHAQLGSDKGAIVSKSPLTTGYEASLATPTHQKRCPNHQASGICFFMNLIKPCTEGTASVRIQLPRDPVSIHPQSWFLDSTFILYLKGCSAGITSKSISSTLAYPTGW